MSWMPLPSDQRRIEASIARWEDRSRELRALAVKLCAEGKVEQAWKVQDLILLYEMHRNVLAGILARMQAASDNHAVGHVEHQSAA